jgi:alpha-L-arabinofuranosidase
MAGLLLGAAAAGGADNAALTVQADKPGVRVSPTLYGIFFEEINRAGEGGIYAEMTQNRSFEDDAKEPAAWSLVRRDGAEGGMALDTTRPLNARNPHSLRLDAIGLKKGRLGVANSGFQGVAVRDGAAYRLSVYARCSPGFTGPLLATLETKDGRVLAERELGEPGVAWTKLEGELTATAADPDARLVVSLKSPGQVWLDMVSLFPKDTFKGHPFRQDLAQLLADMKPSFVRFPGGCYVEGDHLAEAFRWKDSIGDPAERPGHWNLWGYYSSDGLGYHEYLQLCEDLGAAPLFVINCGMSHHDVVRMDRMGEYVQDALDALEYANGPADSKWGSLRAKAGHPAPFNLKFMEIGNENGGPAYNERYALFDDAIRAKYPAVKLVANVWGGTPKSRRADIVDEHYYSTPQFFMSHARQYDTYDRSGPGVYVGEFAVTQGAGQGNLIAAIGEAAFMTGMERNSDVVVMSSYAPLFVHPGWKRWNPNAIVFDAARAYGTPSYHAQAMFARARPDVVLPVEVQAPEAPAVPHRGRIGVGTWATQAEFKDIRFAGADGGELFGFDPAKGLQGWDVCGGKWDVVDGALRQRGDDQPACAFAGDKGWGDGVLTLKARKLGGDEGFLISFQSEDPAAKSWWNLGGWGNQRHAIEKDGLMQQDATGGIETGRWYDIRIEMQGGAVRCFLDGKKVHDARYGSASTLFAAAGKTDAGQIILKVVNASAEAMAADVALNGVKGLAPKAECAVMTGDGPDAENRFDAPTRVAPKNAEIDVAGPRFRREFPARSITVLTFRERES